MKLLAKVKRKVGDRLVRVVRSEVRRGTTVLRVRLPKNESFLYVRRDRGRAGLRAVSQGPLDRASFVLNMPSLLVLKIDRRYHCKQRVELMFL